MNVGIIPDYWHHDEETDRWRCTHHDYGFYDYCIWCKLHPDDVYWVNVYEVGRGYGGPEEGGWWFDYGHPVEQAFGRSIPVSFRLTDFWQARLLREELAKEYQNTGKSSSVLGGEDYRVVIENHPARPYPEERPHYE